MKLYKRSEARFYFVTLAILLLGMMLVTPSLYAQNYFMTIFSFQSAWLNLPNESHTRWLQSQHPGAVFLSTFAAPLNQHIASRFQFRIGNTYKSIADIMHDR